MRTRMMKLAACFLTLGIMTAGQAVCTVCAEESNAVVAENGAEKETQQETANQTEKQSETEAAKKKKKKKKKKAQTETESEADLSMKGQMIFAQCEDHVNIRKGPGKDSEIVGKIYNNCMATVLSKDGEWFEIQSGNAVGFAKVEYFATGEEAEKIAEEVAYHVAIIYADELNIRALPDDDAEVISVAYKEEEYEAVEYKDDWIKVYLGDDVYGYVNAFYAGYDTYYPEAETLEEEQARLDAEAAETEEYYEESLPEETYTDYSSTQSSGSEGSWTQPQTQAPVQVQTQAQTQAPTEAQTQAATEAQTQAATETQTQAATEAPADEGDDDSEEEYDGEVNDDEYYDAATGQMVKF